MKKTFLFACSAAFVLLSSVDSHAADPRAMSPRESKWLKTEVSSLMGGQLRRYGPSDNAKFRVDVHPEGKNRFGVTATVVARDRDRKQVTSTAVRKNDGTLFLTGPKTSREGQDVLRTPRSAMESVMKRVNQSEGAATKLGESGGHTTVVGLDNSSGQKALMRHTVANKAGYPIAASYDMTDEVHAAARSVMESHGWKVSGTSLWRLNSKSVDVMVRNSNNLFGGRPDRHVVRLGLTEDGKLDGSARPAPESKFKGDKPQAFER